MKKQVQGIILSLALSVLLFGFAAFAGANPIQGEINYQLGSTIQGGPVAIQGNCNMRNIIGADLAAWYHADLSPKTFNGSAVSQWNDISGNENHFTQTTAVDQPEFDTDHLSFDGATEFMSAVDSVSLSITGGFTMFAVIDLTDGINTSRNIVAKDGNSAYRWAFASAENQFLGINDGTTFEAPVATTANSEIKNVSSVVFEPSVDVTFRENGVSKGVVSTALASINDAGGLFLLGSFPSSEFFNGDMYEVIIINNDITDIQHDRIGNCLAGGNDLTWTNIN